MDLKTRIIKSTFWYLAVRTWTQAVSWLVTIILARLLVPTDYGLFGMAFAVIALLELFQELGLGVVIIQRQDLNPRQINTIFWIVLGGSLFLAMLGFVGAGLAATFYGEARLIWIVRALTAIFVLNALGTVPYSLLTKEIDFRRRSLAEGLGVLVSAVLSVVLAYADYGVWALVWGQLLRTAVRNIGMAVLCNWIPRFEVSRSEIGDILKFGARVAGASIFQQVSSVTNTAVVGRFLGGHDLGLYSMAQALATNPFHKVSTQVINQLSLPVFSMLQREDEQLRNYFLKISRYLALVALPMQLGMALVAHDLVVIVLSERWFPIVGLFQVLCLSGVWYVLPLPSEPVLTARGRAQMVLRYEAVSFGLMTVAYLIGVRFGLSGVAWAWALSYCSLRTVLVGLTLRELGIPGAAYLKSFSSPLLAAVVMAGGVMALRAALPMPVGPVGGLVRDIAIGGATYLAVLTLIDKTLGEELKGVLQSVMAASRA